MYPAIRIFSFPIATYHVMVALGLVAALLVKMFLPTERQENDRAFTVLIPAAIGLVIGAKLPILISYGWKREFLVTGRSLLGALLGAYIAVRLVKWVKGTHWVGGGDAYVLPLAAGLAFGRLGCLLNGCCWGVHNIPVPAFEIAFHVGMFGLFFYWRRQRLMRGSWFPIYLLAYCIFRFGTEFIRTEPRVVAWLTVYQLLAIAGVLMCGIDLYRRRITA